MKKIFVYSTLAVLLFGCRKTEFDPIERTQGSADFSRYVAVGNSLTQGYQDGGLYEATQKYSYPALIAQQMKIVNPNMENFAQPMTTGNGSGYMHLEFQNGEFVVVSPGDPNGYAEDPSWSSWGGNGSGPTPRVYNNLGVSGMKLVHVIHRNTDEKRYNHAFFAGVDLGFTKVNGNPYSRFLYFGNYNPLTNTGTHIPYLEHIKKSNATFFTCWLGNNDVLGYATSGGQVQKVKDAIPGIQFMFPTLAEMELNGLSDPNEFRQKYDSVLKAFKDIGAKGVVATIPDVTTIPLFTTLTLDVIKGMLNKNTVYIEENNGNVRPMTTGDYVLLNANDDIKNGKGNSSSNPIPKDKVLDINEANACKARTVELNNIIKDLAAQYNYPVVDMYKFLETFESGIKIDGIAFNVKYIEGGAFSLDGVHVNPRGYAIIANEFIKKINEFYGSNIPLVEVGKYKGIIFP